MSKLFSDIGLAAEGVLTHAARLIIEGNDSGSGAGSATIGDETGEDDEKIEGEDEGADGAGDDQHGDGVDDDGKALSRGGTPKQVRAYDRVKGERDTFKTKAEKLELEAQQLREQLAGKREAKQEGVERSEQAKKLAKERSASIVAKLRTLDQKAPDYSERLYEEILMPIYEDQLRTAEEVSGRVAESVTTREQRRAKQAEAAEDEARETLLEAGFDEDGLDGYLEELRDLSIIKQVRNKEWFKLTPDDEQIPALVDELKKKYVKTKRSSPEGKDERRRHQETMGGVLTEGSGKRGGRIGKGGEQDQDEGPGSILGDLARNRKAQMKRTGVMFREFGR